MGTLPTCPCPVLVDTSTTERGTLRLRQRPSPTTDTPVSDMPDLDTLDLDTLVWDTLDSDTLVWESTTERGRPRLSLRLRLNPTTDTLDSDMPVWDTPVWDTLVSDTPGSDMLVSTPAMSVSAPTTWELPCLARKLRNNEKLREVRNFCWKQFEIKCLKNIIVKKKKKKKKKS